MKKMAPRGLEPPTPGLLQKVCPFARAEKPCFSVKVQYSNQLSYGANINFEQYLLFKPIQYIYKTTIDLNLKQIF